MAKSALTNDGTLIWHCPGCGGGHGVPVRGDKAWGWNGSLDSPTLTPSVLLRSGHFNPDRPSDQCWCTYNRDHPDVPAPFVCSVCHIFIRDGQIQFLGDCTHALAGKTVPIPEWEA